MHTLSTEPQETNQLFFYRRQNRHFWKRRQVIAQRLRETLSRGQPSYTGTNNNNNDDVTGTSSAIAPHDGTGSGASSIMGRNNNGTGSGTGKMNRAEPSTSAVSGRTDDCGCDDTDGEVGLTGVICSYDDDQSTLDPGSRRGGRPAAAHPVSSGNQAAASSSK